MVNKARAKGTYGENRVRDFLRTNGFPYCERLALNGSKDRGDLTGVPGVMIEVKTQQKITLASYMDEVVLQTINANAPLGVVIIPRKGSAIERAYVVQELGQWVETIK